MEELELGAEAAVIAAAGLLEPRAVLVELLAGREGRAVDALEHRIALVAAPIRARALEQREGADLIGALHVRPAAEIGEAAVAEERDLLALRDVVEARDLERLALRFEERLRRAARSITSRVKDDFSAMIFAHLLLDLLEILGREGALDQEVVLELLGVVGAPDVDLRGREQALDRVGHHVLGRVADHLGAGGVPGGHDLDRHIRVEGHAQIDQAAVDAAGERRAREPLADPLGDREDARTRRHRERLAIGQTDLDLAHRRGRFMRGRSSLSGAPDRGRRATFARAGPPSPAFVLAGRHGRD